MYFGVPACVILLRFALLCIANNWLFSYGLKACDNPAPNKSVGTIFPTTIAHVVSLCHILVIFQDFHYCYICYGNLWSDVTITIVLKSHETHMTGRLNKCCVCSGCSTKQQLPISLLLLRPPLTLRHNNTEISPINDLQWPLSIQVKKSHLSNFKS